MLRSLVLAPLLLAACSDYGYANKGAEPRSAYDTADTAAGIADTGGVTAEAGPDGTTEVPDTGGPDSGGHPDPGTTDLCYEPEDGYSTNPSARIYTTDSTTPVKVTFVESSTDYDDELDLDSPESKKLIYAYRDGVGKVLTLGPYSSGSELVFGIDVTDTGEHWESGPAGRNADGVVHVAVTYEGGCSWLIGFEDLTGGGDLDYNDVVMRVEGMLRQAS